MSCPIYPVDNFGTVVGENPTPYGILPLWAVNGLSIVYWVLFQIVVELQSFECNVHYLLSKILRYLLSEKRHLL